MDIAIIASLITALATAIMSFLVGYRQRLAKRKKELQQKKLSEALRKAFNKSLKEYYSKTDIDKADYIFRDIRNYLIHFPTVKTTPDIEKQVNAKVDGLKKRIEAIEARFPQEATLEKIASVNDAILATQLETLSDYIKVIQDKMLTKWDVAKIVFATLSALGIVTGLIFGIINLM